MFPEFCTIEVLNLRPGSKELEAFNAEGGPSPGRARFQRHQIHVRLRLNYRPIGSDRSNFK
jgi:hypothetical protein